MEKDKDNKSKFLTRTISGVCLLLILFLIIKANSIVTLLACLFLSIVGIYELLNVFGLSKNLFAIITYLSTFCYYGIIYYDKEYMLHFVILYLVVLLIAYVIKYPKFNISNLAICFFSLVYVAVTFSFIYLLRIKPNGRFFVVLVFICSWGCDTCAYLTGMLLGKHKVTPILSPKKTIEGCIGGVIGAGIIGVLYLLLTTKSLNKDFDIKYIGIFVACMIGAALSQFGDLAASGIKRDNNVKDYGDLIPGHGGVLDRFDSVILTAVAIYFAMIFV